MTESYREECPWCGHTFYGAAQFEAHVLAEGAIEKGLQLELPFGSVRNTESGDAVENTEKEGPDNQSENPFGDW